MEHAGLLQLIVYLKAQSRLLKVQNQSASPNNSSSTVHLAAPKTFYCGVAHTATKGVQVVGWTALGSSKETKGL